MESAEPLRHLDATERDCALRYIHQLAERLKDNLQQIWLFGSAARGDMWPDWMLLHSDIDLLILTQDPVARDIQEELINATYPLFLQCGRQLSPQFRTALEFDTPLLIGHGNSLTASVRKENSSMKDELVHELAENRAALWQAIADIPEEQIVSAPVVGVWTIKDAVGHIAYWEGVILDHVRESYAEGRPRPVRDEIDDVINAREAAKRKDWPWARVRAEYENVRAALIGYVNRLSETDLAFQVPNPWPNEQRFYSVGQMIKEDAIGHQREHTEQIERWKRGNGPRRLPTGGVT